MAEIPHFGFLRQISLVANMLNSIVSIEIFKSPIPLKEPFVISLGPLFAADNLLVRIKTSDGVTGWGECSPFRTIHGESQETGLIVGQYLAKVLIGKNSLDIGDCILAMDKAIFGNACIKSAFDIALFDIASQVAGLPLFEYLGGKSGKILKTDYTVSIGPAEKMAADARKIIENGFEIIKVKLGGTEAEDVERIRQIRDAVGYEIPLRIDANQGWTVQSAISILEKLLPFNIMYCEEPIPRQQFQKLPEIRKSSPIPIMADESCCDHFDAERLIEMGACDLINVKLGKSGGIFKALKIIRMAEKAGMDIQIGGFLESRLGFTASAHLALCSENIKYIDFDTPLMFSHDPISGGIEYGNLGEISLPSGPGLAVFVDSSFLDSLVKVVVS